MCYDVRVGMINVTEVAEDCWVSSLTQCCVAPAAFLGALVTNFEQLLGTILERPPADASLMSGFLSVHQTYDNVYVGA